MCDFCPAEKSDIVAREGGHYCVDCYLKMRDGEIEE